MALDNQVAVSDLDTPK